jgi:hypothetical protein
MKKIYEEGFSSWNSKTTSWFHWGIQVSLGKD